MLGTRDYQYVEKNKIIDYIPKLTKDYREN